MSNFYSMGPEEHGSFGGMPRSRNIARFVHPAAAPFGTEAPNRRFFAGAIGQRNPMSTNGRAAAADQERIKQAASVSTVCRRPASGVPSHQTLSDGPVREM